MDILDKPCLIKMMTFLDKAMLIGIILWILERHLLNILVPNVEIHEIVDTSHHKLFQSFVYPLIIY